MFNVQGASSQSDMEAPQTLFGGSPTDPVTCKSSLLHGAPAASKCWWSVPRSSHATYASPNSPSLPSTYGNMRSSSLRHGFSDLEACKIATSCLGKVSRSSIQFQYPKPVPNVAELRFDIRDNDRVSASPQHSRQADWDV